MTKKSIYAAMVICKFFCEQDCDRARVRDVKKFIREKNHATGVSDITRDDFREAVDSIGLSVIEAGDDRILFWPEGISRHEAWQAYSVLLTPFPEWEDLT